MPVESVPTRRPAPAPAPGPGSSPWSSQPVARLERAEFAPRDVVEPLLRSARSAMASLTLRARAAEQEAQAAEGSASSGDELDNEVVAAQNATQLAMVEVEIEAVRRRRDAAVEEARREAQVLVEAAQEEGRALVAAAREDLDRSLAALPGATPQPTPMAPAAPVSTPVEPDPVPSVDAPAGCAPPTARPTYPPPSPAPTIPPPMVAAPLAPPVAPSFASVLLQAPDGTFHQALVLTAGPTQAPVAPAAPAVPAAQAAPIAPYAAAVPALMPAPAPVPVAEVGALPASPVPAPAKAPGRRLLHLDVILPLVAVLLVLVVLLAWLG